MNTGHTAAQEPTAAGRAATHRDALPVFTGLAVAAPNGLGTDAFWSATRKGVGGIGPITHFDAGAYPVRVAGEIHGFDAREHIPSRLVPATDRATQLSLVTTAWALGDAELDPADFGEFDGSVVTANAVGGVEFIQRELQSLWSKGPRYVTAYMSYAWFYGVNTGQISIRHQLKGPSGVVVTGQVGGIDALAQARRRLRDGQRFVVAGGADAPVCPYGLTAGMTAGNLSTGEDPDTAYAPFDRSARGHVPGEGSAMMILEPLGAARERGARHIYGALTGYGATFDPHPATGQPPTLARAARIALDDAGLTPDDIDVVFADGAAEAAADRAEATALVELFGPRRVPVTLPKTMTGRMYGAGAATDVVSALLAIRDGEIPPTIGGGDLAGELGLDLVTGGPRPARLDHALVLARGDGGFNSAAVVSRVP
ncbi:beta-ketoacyl synthase N-terminal-like domain-containing protein [Streptomyces alanosinicus]|uniref:Actinorhodin polyketide putative beta-ketoacyl synthase 2 n=1 Tax=Streptomyces alanosinicus TaxID=68171 RepID=A0A919D738_9ACTN|nr:beta-ketoacyl synthase N-terminal-like domain-containing protein [Streptomyces alanosinicus]GHE13583.1 actinorhodin polyketide putative beta-ketoacyl synthase 2 [Streptomyces alanosinicus]